MFLKWLDSLFQEKMTDEEFAMAQQWREARHGRPLFREPGTCPWAKKALKEGVLSVTPKDVRYDN